MNTFDAFINNLVDTVSRVVLIALLSFFPLFALIVFLNSVR